MGAPQPRVKVKVYLFLSVFTTWNLVKITTFYHFACVCAKKIVPLRAFYKTMK